MMTKNRISPIRRIPVELDDLIRQKSKELDLTYIDSAKILTKKMKRKTDGEIIDEILFDF